jgi:hypothetical protein
MEAGRPNTSQAAKPSRSNVVKVLHWGDNPPMVICLCGPERFKSEFMTAFRAFTLLGHVVVMPPMFDGTNGGGFINEETQKKLDELQLKKIQMSDIVYIVNPKGVTNPRTRSEIEYAKSLGKEIRYLESTQ